MSAVKKQWLKVRGGEEPSESVDPVDDDDDDDDDSRLRAGAEATLFRGIAARFHDLSSGRQDLQHTVKEATRTMSSPCAADRSLLTRIGRYLLRRHRVAITLPWQKRQMHVDGYTDSDRAGCPEARK